MLCNYSLAYEGLVSLCVREGFYIVVKDCLPFINLYLIIFLFLLDSFHCYL